jgi:hypothetical protein
MRAAGLGNTIMAIAVLAETASRRSVREVFGMPASKADGGYN